MLRLIAAATILLAGCATPPSRPGEVGEAGAMPSLRLAPAALGRELALQQRLEFRHGERRDSIEALVEVDAAQVRLLIHAQGQVALRLQWDGSVLQQTRADWLPAALSGERVLDDLQLVFWPAPAIMAALPQGWQLREFEGGRELRQGGAPVASVAFLGPGHARLQQHRQAYTLDIHSVLVAP